MGTVTQDDEQRVTQGPAHQTCNLRQSAQCKLPGTTYAAGGQCLSHLQVLLQLSSTLLVLILIPILQAGNIGQAYF